MIISNSKKKRKQNTDATRYNSAKRETPLMIYTGLKIYSCVRSRILIDKFFKLGICVSYQRLLELMKIIYEALLLSFLVYQIFIPIILKKGVFLVMAKDNIDKNASSTDAKSHYHGTSISILQFPTSNEPGTELPPNPTPTSIPSSNKLAPLPKKYTVVEPLPYQPSPNSQLFAPLCSVNQIEHSILEKNHDASRVEELE